MGGSVFRHPQFRIAAPEDDYWVAVTLPADASGRKVVAQSRVVHADTESERLNRLLERFSRPWAIKA